VGIPGTQHVSREAHGLQQRLTYDPDQTNVARVLAAVSERVEVRDLSIEDPDIEDVVRRIYSATR
jgi:ABC-2 type transport system ATP-binding protein